MSELTFFSFPSCTSCRKTKKWLKSNNVHFEERHLFRDAPTYEEMLEILSLTTEGLDEILAKRSETYKNLTVDFDELPLSQVVKILIGEPKLLRRPIVTDGKKLVIGYNPDTLKRITKSKFNHLKTAL